MFTLYLVIPCYNESAVLPETAARLLKKMEEFLSSSRITKDSRILFVDDGSSDDTWQIICNLHQENPIFSGCKLSRNKGHQNALLAGLDKAKEKADAIISMDADLQDDIQVLNEFLDQYEKGYEVVYGVRNSRKTDSAFKRHTAQIFYKFMKRLGCEIVYNHADYRLLSKRAAENLLTFREVNLFLRGLVPMVGFRSTSVYYERGVRYAGESKYPLKKMLYFAFDGMTSLSIRPIRIIFSVGLFSFFVSLVMLVYMLISYFSGHTVSGWSSIIASIWALGGLQLLAIGIVGEYIGKIFLETKGRPRYIIEEYLNE